MRGCMPARQFKAIMGAVSVMPTTANLRFNKRGMKVFETDGSRVACVHLRLSAETWDTYHCPIPVTVGVNMQSLMKFLALGGITERMTISTNADTLEFAFQSPDGTRSTDVSMKTLDIEDECRTMNLEFSAHVRMQSDAFAKLCSKFNVIGSTGSTVNIALDSQRVMFTMTSEGTTSSDCLQPGPDIEIQTDDAVELAVSARYMVMASKARALSEQVYLSMSKDTPLRIEYPLDDHSVLAFYIAPRILDT